MISIRAIVKRREIVLPKWFKELLGWQDGENLFFKLSDRQIIVSKADGYARKMIHGVIRIPKEIAKELNIEDGSFVLIIVKNNKMLIRLEG